MTTARSRRWPARTGCVLAAAVIAGTAMPAAEARPLNGDTARVSEGPKGEQLNGRSDARGLSADGRFALFSSAATNLLPADGTPNGFEIYVRDLRNGHVERAGVADDGSKLNASTADASISGDGRYVAFSTSATNVVPGRTPDGQRKHPSDIFVRDLWTGHTELITTGNLTTGVDETNSTSESPTLSADGRYVAYVSSRSDLAPVGRPAGAHHAKANIFVTDRWTHTTRLITAGLDGSPAGANSDAPTISEDGATVGFSSLAGNLVPKADLPPAPPRGQQRFDPYYVWKADTGKITVASTDASGTPSAGTGGARISPDGRFAVYGVPVFIPSTHGYRMDLYARELETGEVTLVNTFLPGTTTTGGSFRPVMTADDRWVYFDSDADNLVPGDTNKKTDVFRTDLWTGQIERVSVAEDSSQSTGASSGPYVDATGETVVFTADDANLVPGATNTFQDVFLRRRQPEQQLGDLGGRDADCSLHGAPSRYGG
ncbi:hypothetical protein ABZW30_46500, partial [Kitasatospora sp. NPDC004669]|uniref:TolB family protein n=1 Tax=Kitasatospora sp. NPDC004669 TaxID=3154555 RepID=UPI0033A12AF6